MNNVSWGRDARAAARIRRSVLGRPSGLAAVLLVVRAAAVVLVAAASMVR